MQGIKQFLHKVNLKLTAFSKKAYLHLYIKQTEQTIAWINHIDAMTKI